MQKKNDLKKQITVFVGCLIKDGKVLLAQRTEPECPYAHLKWELPGGKVDFGETPPEALARESMKKRVSKSRSSNYYRRYR